MTYNPSQDTNIIEAIYQNNCESVLQLLLSGTDVHFNEVGSGLTPLHHVVTLGLYEMGLL